MKITKKETRPKTTNMQFPQDMCSMMSDNETDFQNLVMHKLQSIDNKLTSLCAQHDLIHELISNQMKQVHNTQVSSSNMMEQQQRPVYFKLTISKTIDDLPVRFRLSGRTYDIRDRIKEFGNPVWNKDLKCWDFEYNENMYHNLVAYLSTLTTDITYIEDRV